MAECFKCKKQLTLYGGLNSICRCMNCKQYFCENEGEILKEDKWIEAVKGKTDRTIYDFLCYGCDFHKINEEKVIKEHNEKFVKATEERERAEMLKAQKLHSSDSWEVAYEENEKLPKVGVISSVRRGLQGEFRPCSVYVELYGSKYPLFNTKIFLTFTHYKQSSNYYEKPVVKTEYYCLLCFKRMLKSWWRDLDYSFLTRDMDRLKEKFPDTFNIKKNYH